MQFYYRDDILIPHSKHAQMLFNSWEHGIKEVCLSGGRGMGKTMDLCLYLLTQVRRVPGIEIVVGRTNYGDLASSFVKTLEDRIFKYPLGDSKNKHPLNPFVLSGGVDRPKVMRFDNGSSIRFIGLKESRHRRGMECSIFVLNEGTTEDTSEVWGAMGGSTAGGRGAAWRVRGEPYNQLITDCNPSFPSHWIYKNFRQETADESDSGIYLEGNKLWLGYTHHCNPALVDPLTKELNAQGEQTKIDLDNFYKSEFEKQRMLHSIWCAAEGIVYNMYNPKVHEVEMRRGEFGADSEWYLAQDHGGDSPFAIMLTNRDTNGIYRTFKELATSRITIDQVIGKLDALLTRYDIPKAEIPCMPCDTNVPSFNKALREAGYPAVEADKDIIAGVDTTKGVIGNNRFYINKTSLDERDPLYEHAQGFKEEVLGYAYYSKEKQETMANPDLPVPKRNHWMDTLRYKLHYLEGGISVPDDYVNVGVVSTPLHYDW